MLIINPNILCLKDYERNFYCPLYIWLYEIKDAVPMAQFVSSRQWRNGLARSTIRGHGRICASLYATEIRGRVKDASVTARLSRVRLSITYPFALNNINDPSVSLNADNTELVCKKCHEEIDKHLGYGALNYSKPEPRVSFDADGNVVMKRRTTQRKKK